MGALFETKNIPTKRKSYVQAVKKFEEARKNYFAKLD